MILLLSAKSAHGAQCATLIHFVDDIRAKFSESETMEAAQIYGFLYEIKYAGDDARAYL